MTRAWLTTTVAALALAASESSAADFTVNIGSPVGTPTCGGASTGASSTPVSREVACSLAPSVPGGLQGLGTASFGHVGASAGAFQTGGYFGTSFGMTGSARYADFVTFTSTDPNASIITVGGMNLAFSGVQNATAGANAYVVANLFFGGGFGFEASEDGVIRNTFQVIGGSLSGGSSNALLRSGSVSLFLNQPTFFAMDLSSSAGVGGSGMPESARSDFSNSLAVPFGMDVFVLPAGVTANSGTWLVNNRRVNLDAPAVPEPATWGMMILGFGMIGFTLRRRQKAIGSHVGRSLSQTLCNRMTRRGVL
jgi:hypothetical protein